jgi:voltage-gated potassium channel
VNDFENFSGPASSALPAPGSTGLYVICGAGATGLCAIGELVQTGRKFVVVERDPEVCARLARMIPADSLVEGDATDEAVLVRAGVRKAAALLTTLPEDKLNLVIAVTALQIQPGLRVVCRSDDEVQWPRLRRAGAQVVAMAHIGGRRLATGIIHPETTLFLNDMLAAPADRPIRVEAVVVAKGSEGEGRALGSLDLFRRTGLRVFALCRGAGADFVCNPPADTLLATEDRLIVIGDFPSVDRLAAIVGRWE